MIGRLSAERRLIGPVGNAGTIDAEDLDAKQ